MSPHGFILKRPYQGLVVVQEDGVVENDQRISDEQMCDVSGKRGIQAAVPQEAVSILVHVGGHIVQGCERVQVVLRARLRNEEGH